MTAQFREETKSYRDPMAQRHAAAAARQQQLEEQHNTLKAAYDGWFTMLELCDEAAKKFFAGPDGIIGSKLGFQDGWLVAADGRSLAQITQILGENGERLLQHAAADWQIVVLISVVYYRGADKAIMAEVGFICWDPAVLDTAIMQNFCKHIAGRFSSGDHANLRLTGEQLTQILDSQGEWFLTGSTAYPKREKGTIVFRNKRTGVENLVEYSQHHKTGCNILATIFWLAAIALLVGAIWWFFFSGF